MVADSEEGASRSSRAQLSRFRLALIAVVVLAVTGSWIAIQVQTECEAAARQAVFGYTEALNSGDAMLAVQSFADGAGFSWYSENPSRVGDDARDRDSLGRYFSNRVAQNARLRILFFDFNAGSPVDVLGHFAIYAFDESWELITGKGAVSCKTGKLTVLSIGGA